ncbi:BT1 family protein [Gammaproteobacteria bacterium]
MTNKISNWIDSNFLKLGSKLQISYLPPLMIYFSAGIAGLTGIAGTFFVKDNLGLSAQFLAGLEFWITIPWTLKIVIGNFVDLFWRYKAGIVFLGAGFLAASLGIMVGLLLPDRAAMIAIMSPESWYVVSALFAPIGYVIQDVVADAMTVEAVPLINSDGKFFTEEEQKRMHMTIQTLGRVAIIGGTLLVAIVNVWMFPGGTETLPEAEKLVVYRRIYEMALVIPAISVAGIVLAAWLNRRAARSLAMNQVQARPNWWILGGGLTFGLISLLVGLNSWVFGQEIVFIFSMVIIVWLMMKLMSDMQPGARATLLGTAILVFAFRSIPSPGPGISWWMIDVLHFDQSFIAKLSVIGGMVSLAGLFVFRRFMAKKSMTYIIVVLAIVSTLLSLPSLGMYYGLHLWTAAQTDGIVDARFIAVVNTALESPLGQIAMVPMLAWIAHSTPSHQKATFFAVMASFTNLSLAFAQLFSKYLNQFYIVTREVKDSTGLIVIPADYSELGQLLLFATLSGLVMPLGAIVVVRLLRWRSV